MNYNKPDLRGARFMREKYLYLFKKIEEPRLVKNSNGAEKNYDCQQPQIQNVGSLEKSIEQQ